ncbi:HET domain-containing protein [Aspergillus vadensis CBS 113365]|uniref:HET-domain-containing protein n=1 Tax=Aspergillus vadensis (strain CBS 113365 / IMI 142717 / IBT 24658) TaxID=1448311 RepID=A0A319BMI8_ASPVC|nr:HET-domain-containing protein [Aspergillus vadensis CBS 113365]PYH66903.1 HET-domain-containing protein [Aspergillus vadensis CBS 113365]
MTPYVYSTLPPGSFTRMIRLLPQRERNAPIECAIVHYDLSASESQNHLYEALSYTWGSNYKPKSIVINNSLLPVTENLHTALLYLRDHQLERILWVDAICINQEDNKEKNTQISLMRAIYAQADRVIIWLGVPDQSGENALDTIHQLAEKKVILNSGTQNVRLSRADYYACMRLLKHDWFRRIWVLQEVGVARSIIFRCGLAQVNGYAFCEGLSGLTLSLLPEHVLPVIPLVRNSIARPRSSQKLPGSLPIGELLDTYHTHFASVPHDKIYALLGLCSDNPETPCLRPNYQLAFSAVVRQVVTYVFRGNHSVEVQPGTNIAVIKGKGWILGRITSVESSKHLHDYQTISIAFHESTLGVAFKNEWGKEWVIHASARPVQVYDIVCFLHRASKPTIVRLRKGGRISVIVSMTTPEIVKRMNGYGSFRQQSERKISDIQNEVKNISPVDLILTWDIDQAHRESNSDMTTPGVSDIRSPESLWQTLLEKKREIRSTIVSYSYTNTGKRKSA